MAQHSGKNYISRFLEWLSKMANYPYKPNDDEILNWQSRWSPADLSTVDFRASPFGLTNEGLNDFRGLQLGVASRFYLVKHKRIEKCDLSFSNFEFCRFNSCVFVESKLHYCKISTSTFFNTPMPNCDQKNNSIKYGVEIQASWEEHVRKAASRLPSNLIHTAKIDTFTYQELEKAVVFYHGAWSAPSQCALRLICHALSELAEPPPMYFINADDFSDAQDCKKEHWAKLNELFGDRIGANGETAWIKNGRVLARDIIMATKNPKELIDTRISELFD